MHTPLHFCTHKILKIIMAACGYFSASLTSFKYLTEIPCDKLTKYQQTELLFVYSHSLGMDDS